MTIQGDKVQRSVDIHWPDNVVPEGLPALCAQCHRHRLTRRDDLELPHQCNRVAHLVQQRRQRRRRRPRPRPGRRRGLRLDHLRRQHHSTVNEFEPCERIGWWGITDEWRAYHTWLLQPLDNRNTYVVMEETGERANPAKLAESNPGHMHRGHALWNASLKFLCEK